MSFCCCGAEPSYPHHQDCPFPYYGMDPYTTKAWDIEYQAKRDARMKEEISKKNTPTLLVSLTMHVKANGRDEAWEVFLGRIQSGEFDQDALEIVEEVEEQNGTSDDLIK